MKHSRQIREETERERELGDGNSQSAIREGGKREGLGLGLGSETR